MTQEQHTSGQASHAERAQPELHRAEHATEEQRRAANRDARTRCAGRTQHAAGHADRARRRRRQRTAARRGTGPPSAQRPGGGGGDGLAPEQALTGQGSPREQREHAALGRTQGAHPRSTAWAVGQVRRDATALAWIGHARHDGHQIGLQAPAALPRAVLVHQSRQTGAGALGHLTKLFRRPPVTPAELLAVHVQSQLAGENQPLVIGELLGHLPQAAKLQASGDALLHVGEVVGEALGRPGRLVQGGGAAHGSLDRAPAGQGAPAIVNAGYELLVKRVGDVGAPREGRSATGASDELERRLGEAILQVLTSEAVGVDSQQEITAGERNPGHRLGGIGRSVTPDRDGWGAMVGRLPRCRGSFSACASGRHPTMSFDPPTSPPGRSGAGGPGSRA